MKSIRKSRYLNIKAPSSPHKIRGPLVVVDNEPIRKNAITAHVAARAAFQKLQKTIAHFHQSDRIRFERWLREHFSEVVREITQTKVELSQLQELIFEVETRTWLKNQSFAAAYRDVIERRTKNNGKAGSEEEDEIRQKLNERLGQTPQDDEPASAEVGPSMHGAVKLGPEKMARLKSAYRSMARRFHPDCNADLTPAMREAWFEAQRAYMAGDLELLESIDASSYENSGESHQGAAISLIRRRTEQLLQNQKALLRKVEDLQLDPAWGFTKMTHTGKLQKKMAKELPAELATLKAELKKLQTRINSWKEDAERFYTGFKAPLPTKSGSKKTSESKPVVGKTPSQEEVRARPFRKKSPPAASVPSRKATAEKPREVIKVKKSTSPSKGGKLQKRQAR